jgi:hypothetical protein
MCDPTRAKAFTVAYPVFAWFYPVFAPFGIPARHHHYGFQRGDSNVIPPTRSARAICVAPQIKCHSATALRHKYLGVAPA